MTTPIDKSQMSNINRPSLDEMVEVNVPEPEFNNQLRGALDEISQGLVGEEIKYIDHEESKPVTKAEAMRRKLAIGTLQDARTTMEKGGGDCDDLAVLFAYRLQQRSKSPNYEFGVMSGYAKFRSGSYLAHGLLAVRDIRTNRFFLYDVSNPQTPKFRGSYRPGYQHDEDYPHPDGNINFILNNYSPVTKGGFVNRKSTMYFVSPSR